MPIEVTQKMLDHYKSLDFPAWVRFLNNNKHSELLRRLLIMSSLVDYTDIADDVENAPEPQVMEKGTEVKARIISVRTGTSDKNDCNWFMPTFDIPNDPMVKEFNDFFWELDKEHLSDKDYQRALYKFKTFVKAFGLDLSKPIDWIEDLPALEGWLIVGAKKDDEYGEQNTVRKYIMPK
jgi:hypothetical protein